MVALVAELLAGRALGHSFDEISTVCTVLVAFVGVALVWRISQPLTPLRVALLAVIVAIVAGGCTLAAPFFEIVGLTGSMGVVIVAAGVVAVAFFNWMYDRSLASYESSERFARLVRKVEGRHGSR